MAALAVLAVPGDPEAMVKQFKGSHGLGILLEQGDDFGALVAGHPHVNQIFYIKSGEHRGQKIIPSANGQRFIGLTTARNGRRVPKPVLNGSVVLKGWERRCFTPDGCRIWRVRHDDPPPWYRHGACANPDDPSGGGWSTQESMGGNLPCTFPQVLFITDPGRQSPMVCWRLRLFEELFSQKATHGSWYYNSDTNHVYVKVQADMDMNSAGRKVEITKTRFAFGYDESIIHGAVKRSGIVVQNLVIEKYANPAQTGAVGYYRPGSGWAVENCEVRYNHGIGVKFSGHAVIRNNYLHHNGQFGIACGDGDALNSEKNPSELSELMPSDHENRGWADGYAGSGGKVLNNTVAENRLKEVGFVSGWGAGGSKFSQVSNLLIKDNRFLNNHGPGIWLDFAQDNNIVDWNQCEGNEGPGIFVELSGSVRRNPGTLLPERIPDTQVRPTLVRNNFCASNGGGPNAGVGYAGGINLSSSNRVTVSGNIVIGDGHGIMMNQVQEPSMKEVCYRGICYKVNRHVEYINVYSTYNYIYHNDIVFTTSNGNTGAAGWFYTDFTDIKIYKVVEGHNYPWEEPGYRPCFKLSDRWNFFGIIEGLNAGKPFQNNRYHLVSPDELHWMWYIGDDSSQPSEIWPSEISLEEFKTLKLDVSATTDFNTDYIFWLKNWKSRKAIQRK
jgi:parallel beta-helix repeat protein